MYQQSPCPVSEHTHMPLHRNMVINHVSLLTKIILHSPNLTFGEKGMSAYILSAGPYDLTVSQIIEENRLGPDELDQLLSDMAAKGLICWDKSRNSVSLVMSE